jgi:hypothetical protein
VLTIPSDFPFTWKSVWGVKGLEREVFFVWTEH